MTPFPKSDAIHYLEMEFLSALIIVKIYRFVIKNDITT